MNDFTAEELVEQRLFINDTWQIIFPRKPIFQFHVMIVPVRKPIRDFDDLTDEEIITLKHLVGTITKAPAIIAGGLEGYNMFFNAGTLQTGKHIFTFHEHLFLRFKGEETSPYDLMASGSRWHAIGSTEWEEQKSALSAMFAVI
jgi:diadenosine tetraphosphate (Ap4A) HIT family hydrolase